MWDWSLFRSVISVKFKWLPGLHCAPAGHTFAVIFKCTCVVIQFLQQFLHMLHSGMVQINKNLLDWDHINSIKNNAVFIFSSGSCGYENGIQHGV